MELAQSAIIAANANVVSCELDQERVLLDLTSSRYYSLNKVGAAIWEMIGSPVTLADLRARFLGRFDVDPARGLSDLDALLAKMAQSSLIDIRHDPAA